MEFLPRFWGTLRSSHTQNAVAGYESRGAFDDLGRLVGSSRRNLLLASMASKRLFDIVFAAICLLLLLPLLLSISLLILIADGRPIFFRQKRIGRSGRSFECLKFRSMVKDADFQLQRVLNSSAESRLEWEQSHKLRNDPRIHFVGKLLRKTSLDELPQFLNVLRGDMSVVGPRPIIESEIPRYRESFVYYKAIRPGVTGLWQVSGRNSLTYDERVSLDVDYVQNLSPLSDLKIILRTVKIVLNQSGDH